MERRNGLIYSVVHFNILDVARRYSRSQQCRQLSTVEDVSSCRIMSFHASSVFSARVPCEYRKSISTVSRFSREFCCIGERTTQSMRSEAEG